MITGLSSRGIHYRFTTTTLAELWITIGEVHTDDAHSDLLESIRVELNLDPDIDRDHTEQVYLMITEIADSHEGIADDEIGQVIDALMSHEEWRTSFSL